MVLFEQRLEIDCDSREDFPGDSDEVPEYLVDSLLVEIEVDFPELKVGEDELEKPLLFLEFGSIFEQVFEQLFHELVFQSRLLTFVSPRDEQENEQTEVHVFDHDEVLDHLLKEETREKVGALRVESSFPYLSIHESEH